MGGGGLRVDEALEARSREGLSAVQLSSVDEREGKDVGLFQRFNTMRVLRALG
jgi:hypothetical protein